MGAVFRALRSGSAQRTAFQNRFGPEACANLICGALGFGPFRGIGVQKIRRPVCIGCGHQIAEAYTEQPEWSVAFNLIKQTTRMSLDCIGHLCRFAQCDAACDKLEIRTLQLQHYHKASNIFGFDTVGHFFSHAPEVPVQQIPVVRILVKGRFIRNTPDRDIGRDASVILTARQMP